MSILSKLPARNFVVPRFSSSRQRSGGFTLIEILVVIALIAILAGITLVAAGGFMDAASRTRAKGEIQAMSTALENYKLDNGAYPAANTLLGPPTGAYNYNSTAAAVVYPASSEILYKQLTGYDRITDLQVAGTKTYMSFKRNQVGTDPNNGLTYIQDPWGNSYGYSTGDALATQVQYPNTGRGFFDLWSTGGITDVDIHTPDPTVKWVTNWK